MRYRLPPILGLCLPALLVLTIPGPAAAPAAGNRLTIEAIYGDELTGATLLQPHWAPEAPLLAYVYEQPDERRSLMLADLNQREIRVLLDPEQMIRISRPAEERAGVEPDGTDRGSPSLSLHGWAPDGRSVVITLDGRLFLQGVADGETRAVAPFVEDASDAKFSPDGGRIAFVHEHDLWSALALGGAAERITSGGGEQLRHGEADWIYEEEFDLHSGYAWSPDGRRIAFLELDEQSVPTYPIVEESGYDTTVRYQRYPKAGDPNPRVRVGIVEVESGRTVWLDRAAEYLPRFEWADAETLAVQLLSRPQNELELVLADAATGHSRPVLVERDEHWINVGDDLLFLGTDDTFLWSSERTGLRHLYRYDRDGTLVGPLTSGEWEVQRVHGVDPAAGWVYYSSNEANALGSDLYRVQLDGKRRERLTRGGGTHRVTLNRTATAYSDDHSTMTLASRTTLHDLSDRPGFEIHAIPDATAYGLVRPELTELNAPDGALVRLGLLRPSELEPGRRYPVVVYVYGGPGAPVIRDAWRQQRDLFHQLLVQRGYVVALVDDRASSRLGHRYEIALSRSWGPVAVADHRVAVEHLKSLPYVDPERMAVWGWSGGGYTTCYHMTRTGLFDVGIAVAPVTDWRLYDSIYTERYMGLPRDEAAAYADTSILEAADGLSGRLLLVHGTADDNVHPQNSVRLIQALIEAGRPVDLMLYPGKSHGIAGREARTHLFKKILSYLDENL